ncbi:MAG: hypothetical protein ACREFU_19410, partial [Acetobacteraceae bacterium]
MKTKERKIRARSVIMDMSAWDSARAQGKGCQAEGATLTLNHHRPVLLKGERDWRTGKRTPPGQSPTQGGALPDQTTIPRQLRAAPINPQNLRHLMIKMT